MRADALALFIALEIDHFYAKGSAGEALPGLLCMARACETKGSAPATSRGTHPNVSRSAGFLRKHLATQVLQNKTTKEEALAKCQLIRYPSQFLRDATSAFCLLRKH